MLKLKNHFQIIYLFLITFIGMSLIANNNQLMTTKN
ncbi:MAG: SVM family protein [Candidatus Phytoplasma pruni]|nr:SVM family protein [Candidatus Phytoplasma pruni]